MLVQFAYRQRCSQSSVGAMDAAVVGAVPPSVVWKIWRLEMA